MKRYECNFSNPVLPLGVTVLKNRKLKRNSVEYSLCRSRCLPATSIIIGDQALKFVNIIAKQFFGNC